MDKLFKDNSINGKIRNKLIILYNFDYKMEIFVNVSKYFKSNLYYAMNHAFEVVSWSFSFYKTISSRSSFKISYNANNLNWSTNFNNFGIVMFKSMFNKVIFSLIVFKY